MTSAAISAGLSTSPGKVPRAKCQVAQLAEHAAESRGSKVRSCQIRRRNYLDQLAPFGGSRHSGVGRDLSQWFLEAFTERKLLVFDLGDAEHHDRRAEGGW